MIPIWLALIAIIAAFTCGVLTPSLFRREER